MMFEILNFIIIILILWIALGVLFYPAFYENRIVRILFWFPWGLFDIKWNK